MEIKFLIKLLLAIINARQYNHCYLVPAQKTFYLGPVHMIPRQLMRACSLRACSHDPGTTHCPEAITDPGVNFPSVHGLTPVKATFHFTISMRVQRAKGKIQRNNYHHGSCELSLTCKTSSVSLIFTHWTHRNVKTREVRSSPNCSHEFFVARGNFERRVTRCTTPGNPPCRSSFSPCEQNSNVSLGQG